MAPPTIQTGPNPNDPHDIVYFQRHRDEDPGQAVPAQEFLRRCPGKVSAKFMAVVVAVAAAPPHKFAGGGLWEAMHGSMSGWHEVRVDGQKPGGGKGRHHYRLFCRIDREAYGRSKPCLVLIAGMDKAIATEFSDADYKKVRQLGDEYFARNPRSIL